MQRKLFIIRHGKSSWDSVVDDIDRPLSERGVSNAYEMATRLLNLKMLPDVIYSSPANRALHTAIIMSRVWEMPEDEINIRNNLYLPDPNDIMEVICEVPDSIYSMAVFGHNPGFTYFVNRFTEKALDNLPTAGVAVVTLEMESWNDIARAKVLELMIDYPKK